MYLDLDLKGSDIESLAPILNYHLLERVDDLNWIDMSRVAVWDSYLKTVFNKASIVPNTLDVLKKYFANQVISILSESECYITVDPNIIYTNNYTIDSLARLINYGNLSIQGYPLFDEVYQFVLDNLEKIIINLVIGNVNITV